MSFTTSVDHPPPHAYHALSHTTPLPFPPPLSPISPPPPSSSPYHYRHWLCFALMGLLNNLPYSIILSSAPLLASTFDALPLIGLIQWATVILAIGAKLTNGLYLLHTPPSHRLIASCTACMLGLALLSLTVSLRWGYGLALLACCVVGGYGALCESVVVAYLTRTHPRMLSAWGAGSGGSGVLGTFTFLLLHSVGGLPIRAVYVLIAPAPLLYIAAFMYVDATTIPLHLQLKQLTEEANTTTPLTLTDDPSIINSTSSTSSSSSAPLTASDASAGEVGDSEMGRPSRWSLAVRVGRVVFTDALQLALVYFFEYLVLVGLASQADPSAGGSGWWYDNAYEVLSFCYQVGVLMSRTSIAVVQVPHRHLPWLTLLQGVNAVIWLVQAWHGLMPLWLQFAHMLCVGLLGGAMYVNVFFWLRKDARLMRKGDDRELAINLVTAAYNVGIVATSLVETLLLLTILTRQR